MLMITVYNRCNALLQVNAELETHKSTFKSLKTDALEKSKELVEVQASLDSTKRELMNKQSIMEQQIGALKFQISSHQMEADLALEVNVIKYHQYCCLLLVFHQ